MVCIINTRAIGITTHTSSPCHILTIVTYEYILAILQKATYERCSLTFGGGKNNLLTAVANTMTYTIFYQDGTEYKNITPADLECVNIVGVGEAYEVCFQLSSAGLAKKWYQYSSESGYVSFGEHDSNPNNPNSVAINAYLDNIQPALFYNEGHTYYYVDIEHLGTAAAKHGVVRNHVYQVDVKSIKGYGTPVFIPNSNIVTPEYPELEQESFVAARINVLSLKIVKQEVNIEQ